MKENVGTIDRALRGIMGPSLIFLGYTRWGGHNGHPPGLLAMMAGTAIMESAVTRVCPLSHALGVDTREPALVKKDREAELRVAAVRQR